MKLAKRLPIQSIPTYPFGVSSTFLLEIGTEELPAEFVYSAMKQLQQMVVSDFKDLRLRHGQVRVSGTPRRLAVVVESLIDQQPDLELSLIHI